MIMNKLILNQYTEAVDRVIGAHYKEKKSLLSLFFEKITPKLLRTEWIPRCIKEFQEVMPPISIEYPKIYYLTEITLTQDLIEVAEELSTKIDFRSNQSIHYSHGENGDAIFIYIDNLNFADYKSFARKFWTYLGGFYSVNSWLEILYWCYEFDYETDIDEGLGYHFCRAFASLAISNFVYYKYNDLDEIIKSRKQLLEDVFSDGKINVSYLGAYFALIFTDKNETDDYISAAPAMMQPFLMTLKEFLNEQMKKNAFWRFEEQMFSYIGSIIKRMNLMLSGELINSASKKDKKTKKKARKEAQKSRKINRKK